MRRIKFLTLLSLTAALLVGCAGSTIPGIGDDTANSESGSISILTEEQLLQEELDQQFFANQTQVQIISYEALRHKMINVMGLDENNSQAIEDLDDQSTLFCGPQANGSRACDYTSTWLTAAYKIGDQACAEANAASLFPNGFSDPSSFWQAWTGVSILAGEFDVFSEVAALPELTTDAQRSHAVCLGVFTHIKGLVMI